MADNNEMMNAEVFLQQLEQHLRVLAADERRDILDEYRTHIQMEIANGVTEAEAVADFGDVSELACGILESYRIDASGVEAIFGGTETATDAEDAAAETAKPEADAVEPQGPRQDAPRKRTVLILAILVVVLAAVAGIFAVNYFGGGGSETLHELSYTVESDLIDEINLGGMMNEVNGTMSDVSPDDQLAEGEIRVLLTYDDRYFTYELVPIEEEGAVYDDYIEGDEFSLFLDRVDVPGADRTSRGYQKAQECATVKVLVSPELEEYLEFDV